MIEPQPFQPASFTEEPPVGSFAVDHGANNVWERKDSGWFNHSTAENRTYPWAAVNAPDYRPLRPATDADRERVGLTEPSVNVTEGPDSSTEDAGTSSESAPADVNPGERPPFDMDALKRGIEAYWDDAGRSARTCGHVGPTISRYMCIRPHGHDGRHGYAGIFWDAEPADITEEPPVGSQITDCEGEVWERREGGWTLWRPGGSGWLADLYESALDPWPVVRGFAPLRPTTDEDRKRVGLPVEPAPDDVDPEPKAELDEVEALAKALRAAFEGRDEMSWAEVARAAREHIEAERSEAEAKRDQWKADVRDAAIARADRAEGLHKALREDMDRTSQWPDFGAHAGVLRNLLARDDERAES